MIRVAVVDDHHAVRLGLRAALRSEPGLVPAGVACDGAGARSMLAGNRPDVVLLDYHLPDVDGLTVCRWITARPQAPGVIIYSAFADDAMTVPAFVAGADGIVHKGGPARELFDAIRLVARGGDVLPPISPPLLEAARAVVDPDDQPMLRLLLERMPDEDIARSLNLTLADLGMRTQRILDRLKSPVSTSARVRPGCA